MKALSMTQPWATLVATGAARMDTRTWRTHYRGPLAIHASRGFPRYARMEWLGTPAIFAALAAAGYRTLEDFAFGQIIAVGELIDCVRITADNAPPEPERSFGDFTPGGWAWHFAGMRLLPEPIPAKGSLGVWTPPPEVLERLTAAGADLPAQPGPRW